jgi:SAM-dependent methyltransferase
MSSLLNALRGRNLKARITNPYDEFWDRRLGIQTFGYVPKVGADHDPYVQVHYQPTPYGDVWRILRHLRLQPEDVYVDLGSGLGRTVFAAHRLGAGRAIGVDINGALVQQCRQRVTTPAIEFIESAAQHYPHSHTTVLFMFHPFGPGTLSDVLARLDDSLDHRPRRVRVAYMNPVHNDCLRQSRYLHQIEAWPPAYNRWTRSGHYAVTFWESRSELPSHA